MNFAAVLPSGSVNAAPRQLSLLGSTARPLEARPSIKSTDKSFEERVEGALVGLKSTIAQFAMHLSPEQQEVLSDQLSNIINIDDWYEEDQFPMQSALRDLLAWSIYAQLPGWDSLGVDDDGRVLIAWHTPQLTLTANFDGNHLVRWTSRQQAEGETPAHTAGDCSLRRFAKQARFYLLDEAANGD
jgi:hypothetical protein